MLLILEGIRMNVWGQTGRVFDGTVCFQWCYSSEVIRAFLVCWSVHRIVQKYVFSNTLSAVPSIAAIKPAKIASSRSQATIYKGKSLM